MNVNSNWKSYKVSLPKPDWNETACQSLQVVYHIAHLSDAIRILEDGEIRASLIWDESCLNNTRTCVSWVSPNSWHNGSIYGNVRFEFDWVTITKDKRLYWVEDVPKYNPPAYRILVTEKDLDSLGILVPYDPSTGEGPVYFDGAEWYRNGNYTAEFMIDSNLFLSDCNKISFCTHHSQICSKDKQTCQDIGKHQYQAERIITALLIGRNLTRFKHLLLEPNTQMQDQSVIRALKELIDELGDNLTKDQHEIPINAKSLIQTACLAYGYGLDAVAVDVVATLKSFQNFKSEFKKIYMDFFLRKM